MKKYILNYEGITKKIIGTLIFVLFFALFISEARADFTIQCEAFDAGGEGVGYHHVSPPTTHVANTYRPGQNVQISATTDTGGGAAVEVPLTGEWFAYTVNIAAADVGVYNINLRVKTDAATKKIKYQLKPPGGVLADIPGTSGTVLSNGAFSTKAKGSVYLGVGINKIVMYIETGGGATFLNYTSFVKTNTTKMNYTDSAGVAKTFDVLPADFTAFKNHTFVTPAAFNVAASRSLDVKIIGGIQNSAGVLTGWIWDMNNFAYSFPLTMNIYKDAAMTQFVGTVDNVGSAQLVTPDFIYSTRTISTLVTTGYLPPEIQNHGFNININTVLDFARDLYGLTVGGTLYVKLVPIKPESYPVADINNFFSTAYSAVVPAPAPFNSNVSVDKVDMSQFPNITIDFTTTGVSNVKKLVGMATLGNVIETNTGANLEGDVISITPLSSTLGGPLDIVVVYEESPQIDNAAWMKIDDTIAALRELGYDIVLKKIPFAAGAANSGNWSAAKAGINEGINSFNLPRNPVPEQDPKRWLVFVTPSKNFSYTMPEINSFVDRMIRKNILFTYLYQQDATMYLDFAQPGLQYWADNHMGIGRAGDFMMQAADKFLNTNAMIKRWRAVYPSPYPAFDGLERRETFKVQDDSNTQFGPAISYYIAPLRGIGNQTIIFDNSLIGNNINVLDTNYTDTSAPSGSYFAMKIANNSSGILPTVDNFGYINQRHLYKKADINFKYTGEVTRSSILINKNVNVASSTLGVERGILKDYNNVNQFTYYYPFRVLNMQSRISGDSFTMTWDKINSNPYGAFFGNERVMFRLVKGAMTTAVASRFYPYDFENKQVLNVATTSNGALTTFLNDNNVKYVDFVMEYYANTDMGFAADMVQLAYSNGNLNITGLPLLQQYTLQVYTLKDDPNGKYRIITNECEAEFTVQKPALDQGQNVTENNIFTIDNTRSMFFPSIESYFSTKTRFDVVVTFSSIQMKASGEHDPEASLPMIRPNEGRAGFMEEILRNTSGAAVVGEFAKEVALGSGDVGPSNLPGLVYPLDIVFCIDDSGSMGDEIAAVADGVEEFTKILGGDPNNPAQYPGMGFNVRFNLISFGAPQATKYWYYYYGVNQGNAAVSSDKGDIYNGDPRYVNPASGDYEGLCSIGLNGNAPGTSQATLVAQLQAMATLYDNNYLAVYKDSWYSNPDNGQLDISGLKTRLQRMMAGSGYNKMQENGQMAIYYATELLKTKGRSLSPNRKILDNNSGVIPSKKWIIVLTDENMDDETLPPGCATGTIMSNLVTKMNITADDLISLTAIVKTKKPADTPGVAEAINIDCSKHSRVSNTPADTGGRYYGDFVGAFGETVGHPQRFKYYDMGAVGEFTKDALLEATEDIGIIKRWKLVYRTPNTNSDGTYRDMYYNIKNVVGTKVPEVIASVEDKSDNSMPNPIRRYKAPVKNIAVTVTEPDPTSEDKKFKITPEGNLSIFGTVGARVVPPRNLRLWITKANAPDTAVIGNTERFINLNQGIFSQTDAQFLWQDYLVNTIPKTALVGQGALFDVYVQAFNVGGDFDKVLVEDVKITSNPPKLRSVDVVNKTTAAYWTTVKDRAGSSLILGKTDGALDLVAKYSELHYADATLAGIFGNTLEYPYEGALPGGLTLASTDARYDGGYTKAGDRLRVTVKFIVENISNDVNYLINNSGDNTSNYIRANIFGSLIAPTTVSMVDTTVQNSVGITSTVKLVTAVWDDVNASVPNGFSGIQTMTLNVVDAEGNKLVDKIENGSIEITRSFSDKPGVVELSSKIMDDYIYRVQVKTEDVAITGYEYYSSEAVDSKFRLSITIDPSVKSSLSNKMNGIRAIKVSYDYDNTIADIILPNTPEGNTRFNVPSNGPTPGAGKNYFYYIPTASELVQGSGSTEVNVLMIPFPCDGHKDDGKYNFYCQIVDFAALETDPFADYSNVALKVDNSLDFFVYEDNVAPRIPDSILIGTNMTPGKIITKVTDAFNVIPPELFRTFSPQYMKAGDTFTLQYYVQDVSLPDDSKKATEFAKTLFKGTMQAGGYIFPDFSSITQGEPSVLIKSISTLNGSSTPNVKQAYIIGGLRNLFQPINENTVVTTTSSGEKTITLYASDIAGNVLNDDVAQKLKAYIDNIQPLVSGVHYVPMETLDGAGLNGEVISVDASFGAKYHRMLPTLSQVNLPGATRSSNQWSDAIDALNVSPETKPWVFSRSHRNGNISKFDMFLGFDASDAGSAVLSLQIIHGGKTEYVPYDIYSTKNNNMLPIKGWFTDTVTNDIGNTYTTKVVTNPYLNIYSGASVRLIDMAGNVGLMTATNQLFEDTELNLPNPGVITIKPLNNGVTLNYVIPINIDNIVEAVGLSTYEIISFKDERGNSLPMVCSEMSSSGTIINGSLRIGDIDSNMPGDIVTIEAAPNGNPTQVIKQSLNRRYGIVLDSLSPVIGGKAIMIFRLTDHLGNSATYRQEILVQKPGILIKSQDTNTNKEIRSEIGGVGAGTRIQNRIEGGIQRGITTGSPINSQ